MLISKILLIAYHFRLFHGPANGCTVTAITPAIALEQIVLAATILSATIRVHFGRSGPFAILADKFGREIANAHILTVIS